MYACIDLGSNSFHLLIGEWKEGEILIIERCSEKVQLGEGVQTTGLISDAAFRRGLACLRNFESLMKKHGVERYWALGTNTFRVCSNAEHFVQAAADIGLEISIISGVQEAVLIYAGVSGGLPESQSERLVIDIGGGSTELIVGRGHDRLITHSLPVGCVSWRDRYFSSQAKANGKELARTLDLATRAAQEIFQSVAPGVNHYQWTEAFASSGTAKMLAAICESHGANAGEMSLRELKRLQDQMLRAVVTGSELPGLKEKRRDLLLPGCAIMVGLMEATSCDYIRYSPTALREGMLDFIVQSGDDAVHALDRSKLPEVSYAES